MRKNKKSYVLKILFSLFWIALLGGCQLSAEKRTARKEMQETLQEASDIDAKIAKNRDVPEGVRKAFLPAIMESQPEHPIALEKHFDLVADQVPAKLFFLSLVEDTPYNITVHPEVDGKISLKLKKVTVREVLDTVRNVYGFDYRQTTQGIEILPATLQTRAFVVNYLDLNRGGSSETQVSAGTLQSSTAAQAGTPGNPASATTTESGSNTEGAANSRITTTSKADFWQELKTAVQTIVGTGEGRTVAVSPLASLLVVQAMPNELKKIEDFYFPNRRSNRRHRTRYG